ncbi:MAG TPA: hypothetical protein VME18_02140 [Acidobacteriaceae bacterium]|nr:hypothetical protein [Acidobacteriaceae bacterium]
MRSLSQITKLSFVAVAALAIASLPSHANAASTTSNAASVNLTATLNESLSISTGSTSAVTFALADGQTVDGNAAVPVTTTYVLLPSRTTVKVYGYFASSTAALTDNYTTPDNIPSSDVLAEGGALNTPTAFSGTNSGFGGASASLLLDTVSTSGGFVGSKADSISLEIATPSSLPAGTYTGVLTFQAQAN